MLKEESDWIQLSWNSGTYELRILIKEVWLCTAIPYRASTGPEQGIPCVVFPHREKPVFISLEPCNENRFFPVGNTTQGKPCFHYRVGFAVYAFTLVPDNQSHTNTDLGTLGGPRKARAVQGQQPRKFDNTACLALVSKVWLCSRFSKRNLNFPDSAFNSCVLCIFFCFFSLP